MKQSIMVMAVSMCLLGCGKNEVHQKASKSKEQDGGVELDIANIIEVEDEIVNLADEGVNFENYNEVELSDEEWRFFNGEDPAGVHPQDGNSSQGNLEVWTPERIQKNPKEYLEFAMKELEGTTEKLEARLIKLRALESNYLRKEKVSEIEETKLDTFLDRLKSNYQEAAESLSWPVQIDDQKYTMNQLQNLIVKTAKDLEHQSKIRITYLEHLGKIQIHLIKTQEHLSEVASKQMDLEFQRDLICIQNEVDAVQSMPKGEQGIEARLISLKVLRKKLKRRAEQAGALEHQLDAILERLKAKYLEAENSDSWPVQFDGKKYTVEEFKKLILKISRDLKRQSKMKTVCHSHLEEIDNIIEGKADN